MGVLMCNVLPWEENHVQLNVGRREVKKQGDVEQLMGAGHSHPSGNKEY